MNDSAKGVLLAVGSYVLTIGIALFIAVLAIIILMVQSAGCSAMSRALLVLWTLLAVLCVISIAAVVFIARKYVAATTGRIAMVATYGLAIMASLIVVAFGLMVLFNC